MIAERGGRCKSPYCVFNLTFPGVTPMTIPIHVSTNNFDLYFYRFNPQASRIFSNSKSGHHNPTAKSESDDARRFGLRFFYSIQRRCIPLLRSNWNMKLEAQSKSEKALHSRNHHYKSSASKNNKISEKSTFRTRNEDRSRKPASRSFQARFRDPIRTLALQLFWFRSHGRLLCGCGGYLCSKSVHGEIENDGGILVTGCETEIPCCFEWPGGGIGACVWCY